MGKRDYFKAIPACYVILEEGKKVLLLRRSNTKYFDGYLSLPAGHVESGESLKSAAAREAYEEVGVKIAPVDLKLVHVLNRPTLEGDGGTRLDFFFVSKEWKGKVKNVEPHKCSELLWVKKDKLPPDVIPEVKQALEAAFSGVVESEFGWDDL